MNTNTNSRRAFSLVGMLVTLLCLVVLMSISLGMLNTAVTGAGKTLPGSVASFKDQTQLMEIYKGFLATSAELTGLPTPSLIDRSEDATHDTTASLFSAAIAANATAPSMLISGNEHNPWVEPDEDYDYAAYNPGVGSYWDPTFKADLAGGSNVSFAHLPLWGARYEKHWAVANLDGRMPVLGTRGPKDGIVDQAPESASSRQSRSYTLGRDGQWAGHVLFADGHVSWTDSPISPATRVGVGEDAPLDGLFSMEEGPEGRDAILAFTRMMKRSGPVLQFD